MRTPPLSPILQRDARPRQPLTWEERRALLPVLDSNIRLLEKITESDVRPSGT